MQLFDGQGLQLVNKAFGLSGGQNSEVHYDEQTVQQTVDVVPLIRRGRLAIGDGIWAATVANVHGGAGAIEGPLSPYSLLETKLGVDVAKQFDIWFLGARAERTSGATDLASPWGRLSLTEPSAHNLSAAATISSWFQGFGGTTAFGSVLAVVDPNNEAFWPARIRLARDALFTFETQAAGIATWTCVLRFGVFPVALGQDAY